MYPGITFFRFTIPSYWVMALIGAILSFLFVHIRKRKFHIPGDDVTHIFLFCVVGGIIGAKLLHLLVALPNVLAHLDVMIHSLTYGQIIFSMALYFMVA